MQDTITQDKTGAALDKYRFALFQEVAEGMTNDAVFPTGFDVVLRLRRILQDPNYSLDQLAKVVGTEPVVSLRLVNLANSAAYRRGNPIRTVKDAVGRLGVNSVRSIAMSVVMAELLNSKGMSIYGQVTQSLWEHSLRTACASQVISRRLTRVNPDEAMLAGLVHDVGVFYLLYRFANHEELLQRPDSSIHLAARWHEAIGHHLLMVMGVPDEVAEACLDHDSNRPIPARPVGLTDVVYVGNMIAGGVASWLGASAETVAADQLAAEAREIHADLMPEIEDYQAELGALLGPG
jgi:HD-like signal output (HDOD) protein